MLDELRVTWETKLLQSGALDPTPAPAPCASLLPAPPRVVAPNFSVSIQFMFLRLQI